MWAALAWGTVASASLILGGVVALAAPVSQRTLGIVMAFGSGVLISALAFELVEDALDVTDGPLIVAGGLLAGSLLYAAGNRALGTHVRHRKRSGGQQADASGPGIVLGIVLDGIPESLVLGLTILETGAVSVAFLVAVFLSNLPEAVAATTGLRASGWQPRRIIGLWCLVAAVSGLAAMAGFALFDSAGTGAVAFVLAFAAGAILTMLADTMMPEAFEHAGDVVGVVTTLGFCLAIAISSL
jgi:ZIP family zinc transporter